MVFWLARKAKDLDFINCRILKTGTEIDYRASLKRKDGLGSTQIHLSTSSFLKWPVPKTANATVNKVENLSDLFSDHLKLVIPIRRNRKNRLVPLAEKLLLRKRSLIETINDQLKNASQLCHIRHRSPLNAVVHLVAGLVCYQHQPNNSKLRLSESEQEILRGALPGGEPLIIRMDEDGSGQTITGP